MHPTITRVKGAHRVQPDIRSNRAMPMPPGDHPGALAEEDGGHEEGEVPQVDQPPLGAKGSRMFTRR